MIKIENEQDKDNYFQEQIKEDGAYFKVKYLNGEEEFIWVKKFNNWRDDGSSWYLESPNHLIKYDITGVSLEPYYDEEDEETYIPYEHCYIEGNTAYEIDSLQTSPFLPEKFQIEFVAIDGTEVIKYIIQSEKDY